MENYDLQEDEVVLYKGKVLLKNSKGSSELILTNYNFVIIAKIKKLFSSEQVMVEVYPVSEVKYYQDIPQVLKKGNLVELYLLHDETEFSFESGKEAHKFINAALKLLTNKTAFERGVEKTKKAISIVDTSLGVDSIGVAKNVAGYAFKNNVAGKVGTGIKAIGHFMKKK